MYMYTYDVGNGSAIGESPGRAATRRAEIDAVGRRIGPRDGE